MMEWMRFAEGGGRRLVEAGRCWKMSQLCQAGCNDEDVHTSKQPAAFDCCWLLASFVVFGAGFEWRWWEMR